MTDLRKYVRSLCNDASVHEEAKRILECYKVKIAAQAAASKPLERKSA
jgi:hypothetical protein